MEKPPRDGLGSAAGAVTRSEQQREAWRGASRRYKETHREQVRERRIQQYAQLRAAVRDRYGDSCACCGTTEDLSIDHVNGDGKEHRTSIGIKTNNSVRFYRWLLLMYLPPGYQMLCKPCNSSKQKGDHCRLDHSPGAPPYEVQVREHMNARKRQYRREHLEQMLARERQYSAQRRVRTGAA